MSNPDLWLKVIHILAVISWMAGMLYLPRLFVYHVQSPQGSEQARTFVVMEGRLMRIIMLPAMLVTWHKRALDAALSGVLSLAVKKR